MPVSNLLARAVTLALVTLPGVALAEKFDYSLYTGIEHSNNINLSTDQPISENVLIPGLDFNYSQQGSAFQANVAGTLEYYDYLNGHFDNQVRTQLVGQANWSAVPDRLDFSIEDYAGVEPVDSLTSDAPGNQQQTNVLVVGPTLHLRFSDAMRGQVELRYIDSRASKVDEFNSSRGMAAARVFRDLSPTDQVSLNVETQRVDFAHPGANVSDYVRNEAYLRYTSKLALFDADILLGGSQINFDHQPGDSSPLARVTLGWHPSTRSTLNVSGQYQYADAAQDMMLAPTETVIGPGGGVDTGNNVINSEVYLEKSLGVTYTYTDERLSLTLAPMVRRLHYLNDPTFDQKASDLAVAVGYRLQPLLSLSAFADGERLTYPSLDRRDKTLRFGLNLTRTFTSHWTSSIQLTRQHRDSDAAGQSYRETQILFNVVYRR